MRHKGLEDALWIGALLGELSFAVVALVRGRWRSFPASTLFITFPAVASVCFAWVSRHAPHLYATLYWRYMAVNFLLQLLVIVELARNVLSRTPGLVRGAWKQFLASGILGAAVALGLAIYVAPPAQSPAEQVEIRADLFTSLLTCELVIVMMMTANNFGLGWRNHVMAIGEGLLVYATTGVIVDSLHSYFGLNQYYAISEYTANLVYIGALVYWNVQLWREEPAFKEPSQKLRKYLVALHH